MIVIHRSDSTWSRACWCIVVAVALLVALCGAVLRPRTRAVLAPALLAVAEQRGHVRVIVTLDSAPSAVAQVLARLPAPQAARQIAYVQRLAGSMPIAAVALALADATLHTSACDSNPAKPAIDALRALGIATIVPAGNGGGTGVSAPACVSSTISVGATDTSDAVASFSNRTNALSLFAPGVAIFASVPSSTFVAKSGTSTAAATVAGAWAVLRQRRATATNSSPRSAPAACPFLALGFSAEWRVVVLPLRTASCPRTPLPDQ